MKPYNILFLCTHNSSRSILAEALATTRTNGKFIGHSAGSTPGKAVIPSPLIGAYPTLRKCRAATTTSAAPTGPCSTRSRAAFDNSPNYPSIG